MFYHFPSQNLNLLTICFPKHLDVPSDNGSIYVKTRGSIDVTSCEGLGPD